MRAADLPSTISFNELSRRLASEYTPEGTLRDQPTLGDNVVELPKLSYTDSEGDVVSIANGSDWTIARDFAVRYVNRAVTPLLIHCDRPIAESTLGAQRKKEWQSKDTDRATQQL